MTTKKPPTHGQDQPQILDLEQANELALEHQGWAQSIARSVARAWNLDWELDGLDGAAMEALLFCARRFQPGRGVPFKGYARKRIHEASTEAARKSRGWRKSTNKSETQAREVSAELLNIFPELRVGEMPLLEDAIDGGEGDTRAAIRHLLMGANLIAARQELSSGTPPPDELMDLKRLLERVADLEPVHQSLIWKIYWEGISMRSLADEWETDELNVIREHKAVLEFLQKSLEKKMRLQPVKVRPGLKQVALKLKRKLEKGEFRKLVGDGRSSVSK